TPGLYAATLGRAAWNIQAAAVAANLNQAGVLRLTGTNAGDRWLLSRDPNQPWLLNVTENLIFTQSFQLSTIQRIEVSGLGGDDTLEINVDNGPINVREKIHFDDRVPQGTAGTAAGEAEEAGKPAPSQGDPFLRRLFESGFGAFRLDDVGEDAAINSPEALRAALDALDATPGNVTFTDVSGVTTFNVQVVKSLEGPADLEVANQVLGGLLKLDGTVDIAATVALNLTFGVDDTGFFVKPNATSPEIVLSNVRITGKVKGAGQLGFIGVTVSDATLTVDPAVKVAVKLRDPGTDAADGIIRHDELLGDIEAVATTTLQGNPS